MKHRFPKIDFLKIRKYIQNSGNIKINFSRAFDQSSLHSKTQHILFSSFAIFAFITPYFAWSEININSGLSISLWIAGGFLCGLILVKDYWPTSWENKFPLFWYFSAFYFLPFLNTYMILDSQGSTFWLVNLGLSLFLLAVIFHWLCFVLLLSAGIGAGILVFKMTHFNMPLSFDSHTLFLFFYLILFSCILGIFFSSNRMWEIQTKKRHLKALSASIAHEMRTPLSGLQLGTSGLLRYLPNLIHGYKLARGAERTSMALSNGQLNMTELCAMNFQKMIQEALLTIDMILIQLKDLPPKEQRVSVSFVQCIHDALNAYPFKNHERKRIEWDESRDFSVLGHRELLMHVIFFLLQQSLKHMRYGTSGLIRIWISHEEDSNVFHYRDISKDSAAIKVWGNTLESPPNIGYSNWKRMVEHMNGSIECEVMHNEYVEFALKFQKPKEENFNPEECE